MIMNAREEGPAVTQTSVPQDASRARREAARLTAQDVRGVALTWVDNSGITRVKAVPAGRLGQAAEQGVGMSPVFDVFLLDDSITTSTHIGGPDGDLRLFPDLDRLTVLAAQPGWAWAPADRYDQQGLPHPACQRQFTRRMTGRAAETGLELLMGFETEWVVLSDSQPAGPDPAYATRGPAYGMSRLVDLSGYLAELLAAFSAQDVEVLQLHPEYAPGQFEVSVAPSDALGAADLSVLVRETIRAVSLNHGLTPVFAPVVTADGVGNGGHLHLSLWERGRNLCQGGDASAGMTRQSDAFLAGVLRELPALLAVGAPSVASYLRLQPGHWAGAFQCWGVENREAALRFVPGPPNEPHSANAELKCFDPAANPYLVTGAVIAAGLAGIRAGLELPAPVSGDPALGGGQPRLPQSLQESVKHFQDSAVLREAMGDPLFEAIAAVRRAEVELFEGADPDTVVSAACDRY